jgi:exodeoxyribonuclease VII large subunit
MLATASRRAEVDVLLLVRGGGSIEDLWSFNEEVVARAIRASTLPVIVGVGHESDFTIADFAADLRAPTPTAAAELVAPERESLLRELGARVRAVSRALERSMGERAQQLDHAVRLLTSPRGPIRGLEGRVADLRARCSAQARAPLRQGRSATERLTHALMRSRPAPAQLQRRLAELVYRLQKAQQRTAQLRASALALRAGALVHLNVQGVLDRGFAILRDTAGRPLTSAAGLAAGATVEATLAQGSAQLVVTATKPAA